MTTIEKSILATIVVLAVLGTLAVGAAVVAVNEAGGVKQVIIGIGREAKDIAEKIAKD